MSKLIRLTVFDCTYVQPDDPRSRLDGDTFRCRGNVEPIVPDVTNWVPKVRLVRVNAPETGEPGAEKARSELIAWLQRFKFDLHCFARDKYGRLLADAESGGKLLSDYMLEQKLVVPMTMEHAQQLLPEASNRMLLQIAHPNQELES